jgi:hypothetical protein
MHHLARIIIVSLYPEDGATAPRCLERWQCSTLSSLDGVEDSRKPSSIVGLRFDYKASVWGLCLSTKVASTAVCGLGLIPPVPMSAHTQ